MPQSNTDMVRRSHVKAWLREFARPSTIQDLLDSVPDDAAHDRRMLEEILSELIEDEGWLEEVEAVEHTINALNHATKES